MILSINAKGFRGLEFDQSLSSKTLFVGPNGAGKSARSDAVIFLLTGSLPGKARPDLILDTYGSGEKLTVGGKIDKKMFHRQLCRDKKGAVSQAYLVDRKKAKREDFVKALVESGAPKVVDLSAFVGLSNQKRIDYIFELFPPSEDLGKLEDEIQILQEKINAKHQGIRDGEKLIASLSETKAEMKLPQGTLAEIRASIEETTVKYREVSKQITAAEAAYEAEQQRLADIAKAEAKLKAEHEKRMKDREAEVRKEEQAKAATKPKEEPPPIDTFKDAEPENKAPAGYEAWFDPKNQPIEGTQAPQNSNGIQRIIDAMERVGCTVCAAHIVAKAELKKHQPMNF